MTRVKLIYFLCCRDEAAGAPPHVQSGSKGGGRAAEGKENTSCHRGSRLQRIRTNGESPSERERFLSSFIK